MSEVAGKPRRWSVLKVEFLFKILFIKEHAGQQREKQRGMERQSEAAF